MRCQPLEVADGNMMEWLRWHLEGNLLAIVLTVLIAVAIVAMAIFGTPLKERPSR